jgi:hypothetical protein
MRLVPFAVVLSLLLASSATAQLRVPLPRRLSGSVGLPDSPSPRFANVTVEFGPGDWAVVGCVSAISGSCLASRRVVLTPAQQSELLELWADVTAMPRCEPAGFVPGDPEYSLETGAVSYRGHLPAASANLAVRLAGRCLADARLAWWLAQQLGPSPASPGD